MMFVFVQYLNMFKGLFFIVVKLGLSVGLHLVDALMAFVVLLKLAKYFDWKSL